MDLANTYFLKDTKSRILQYRTVYECQGLKTIGRMERLFIKIWKVMIQKPFFSKDGLHFDLITT